MSIIITYEKYTLKVISVTKVKEIINETEIICGAMYKTLVTNNKNAYYTDANGNMYMNMNFTKQWYQTTHLKLNHTYGINLSNEFI